MAEEHDIYDAFSNHSGVLSYKASHWRTVLDAGIPMNDPREPALCKGCPDDNVIEVFNKCRKCAERVMSRYENKTESLSVGGVQ